MHARKRVCIVGAGASGSSAAYALSRHPDEFEVTVFDKEAVAGGMATSIDIDAAKYGASYINDGVQGCSPAFANTIRMFKELGFAATEVGMQISFGKGEDFWSNVFPSSLTQQFQDDIKKFGRVLRIIKAFEIMFTFIPVRIMLRLFRFSRDFGDKMVYPLVALFFGTGNQTPYIASTILERVFMDPSMRLFEFNDKSLLASIPTMLGFPKLHDVYQTWKTRITEAGNVTFKLGHEVHGVVQRKAANKGGVIVEYKDPNGELHQESFDEIILACDADSALKLLGKTATWKEKKVLGSVKYLYDVTITHNDLGYMQKHYETEYKPSLHADSQQDPDSADFAQKNFRPLYYTLQYPQDKSRIEMSFDLTHYQPQFRGEKPAGPVDSSKGASNSAQDPSLAKAGEEARKGAAPDGTAEPPLDRHVFQTIFLDRDGSQDLWTWDEIKPEHRIYEKWWKQQSHRWQHYAKVVPWMMFINGKNHTHFAGAWSVLNMHELAVTSGFAAAYRLGAKYPFQGDEECQRLFVLYLALSHGVRMVKFLSIAVSSAADNLVQASR
ncbi:FAD/NAD-P-binding domain-containing protein, partial [Sistotremastrum niveocremeum HHB9708]